MLILASQSPRRKEILAAAGFDFTVHVPAIPEEQREGESPQEYVMRLAEEKAAAVPAGPDDVVLGADTVVVVGHFVLEKPRDAAHAAHMLKLLAGREHLVITGICVRHAKEVTVDHASTLVRFVHLSDEEIEAYAHTPEPIDKAGGYAIQGLASKFIDRIEGDYFNVVGLPVALVYKHLKALGAEAPDT